MGANYKRPSSRKVTPAQCGELQDRNVAVARVAKVVKGGRRFSFSVLVVTGDGEGNVGYGLGKANEVPVAVKKASDQARAQVVSVPLVGSTIPFEVTGTSGAAKIILKPASPGTGVIAGGAARALLEAAGVKDILTKAMGSRNPHNLLAAVMDGLMKLENPEEVASRRGKTLQQLEYKLF